jgi:porin
MSRLTPATAILATLVALQTASGQSQSPDAPANGAEETSTTRPAEDPTTQPMSLQSLIPTLPDYSGDIWNRSYLTGDWGGARTELANHGILFDMQVTQVLQQNVYGGKNTSGALEYGGSADYTLKLDTARMGLWPGGLFTLHGETQFGRAVNANTGSLMSPNFRSLLPVAADPGITTLSEFYIMQALSEKLVIAAGKIDLTAMGDRNAFAGDASHTTQFMNTAFNVNPVLLAAAPYTSMAAGVILVPTDWLQISSIVADNDPEGAATMTGFNTAFHGRDWTSVMQEYQFTIKPFDRVGHQRFGWLWTSKDFSVFEPDSRLQSPASRIGLPSIGGNSMPKRLRRMRIGNVLFDSGPVEKRGDNWALYYNFDQYLFNEAEDPTQGWGLFGRFGLAPTEGNLIQEFYSIGLGGKGAIPRRDRDTWGAGYYCTRTENTLDSLFGINTEQGVEMFYSIEVTPWFHLTPDLQIIFEPADGFGGRETAIVCGIRGQVNL